jgi:phosphatidylglycerol lysyltransferase
VTGARVDDEGFCCPVPSAHTGHLLRPCRAFPFRTDGFWTPFRSRRRARRRPVFYQISLDWIPYLLTEATTFSSLAKKRKCDSIESARRPSRKNAGRPPPGERDGVRFRILAPEQIAERLPELPASPETGSEPRGRERQFSIGFFEETYLSRFPYAVIEEQAGRPPPRSPTCWKVPT